MTTYAHEGAPLFHWRKTSPLSAQARLVLSALEFRGGDVTAVATVTRLSEQKAERTLRSLERRGYASSSAAGWSISERGLEVLS